VAECGGTVTFRAFPTVLLEVDQLLGIGISGNDA
jgi:hypothetical protein